MKEETVGFMSVLLPKDKVVDFEDYFNDDNARHFIGVDARMWTNKRVNRREDMREREYQLFCEGSLETCFIQGCNADILDVCRKTGGERLEIFAANANKMLRETLTLKDGKFHYTENGLNTEERAYNLLLKQEMEAE